MREHITLPRLYVRDILKPGLSLSLSAHQAHFLHKVLRLSANDLVRVFQTDAGEYLCKIRSLNKRACIVEVGEHLRPPQCAPDLWLLFAPVKRERNRFIVEKATELGVAMLQPVITARTTSKIRMDKMDAHITEAAEQTERLDLPLVQPPVALEKLLTEWDESRVLIFADEAGDSLPAAQILANTPPPCAILIGPEGGFTPEERALLRSKPFVKPISLGPRILRSDTAVIASLALWQALSGDWQ